MKFCRNFGLLKTDILLRKALVCVSDQGGCVFVYKPTSGFVIVFPFCIISVFLSCVSILTRDIDIANLSVRLSVTFRYQMKTA